LEKVGILQLTNCDPAKTSGMPACFYGAKTPVVEVTADFYEQKS
jgi:hypothetical protein